jgi:predicted aldo/keto reductase-like oxidoreductase
VFWDTADTYGTHDCVKLALKKAQRDKVTILTKTDAETADKVKEDIDRFLKELDTDYIDILLLHSRTSATWPDWDKASMEVMSQAKEKKKIRSVGISCHSTGAMKAAAKTAWLDICMVRLNPDGERMDAEPETVLPIIADLRAAGKGVVGIKTLGEGSLVEGGRHNEALKFALTKNAVHAFSIGTESVHDFQDNINRIEKLAIPF